MTVPVMAISNLVLTHQIYSEETKGAHAHNRGRVPLIENCEKNYKQTCSKQKIANVSSVNECHKIDASSRVRKAEHMKTRQNVPGRSKMASKP